MAAVFRAYNLVFARVSCVHCREAFSLKGLARHHTQGCYVLQDEIDYIDSRIGA